MSSEKITLVEEDQILTQDANHEVHLRIQSGCGKIRTRNMDSVSEHFSRTE